MIHEDERRILEDWPEAKIITAKETCVLGDHHHKIKTEKFILVSGEASLQLKTNIGAITKKMKKGIVYDIYPYTHHSFILTKGSILIGLCSHPFDPTDDYRL